jgi:hypothetical protein
MATERQIVANRRNALNSTGPQTAAGKRRSRRNAFRHGLTAITVIDTLESAADFEKFERKINVDYSSRTAVEFALVARLPHCFGGCSERLRLKADYFRIRELT